MNISILLMWMAGGALVVDFIIYLFSNKYRKYGGHLIGAMAYLILLADLTYSLYLGKSDTAEFRTLLTGTLVVGAFFILEYTVNTWRHIHQHERGVAAHSREKQLEELIAKLDGQLSRAQQNNHWLQEEVNRMTEREEEQQRLKAERFKANKAYEDMLDEVPESPATREGFQLYTLLVRGYEAERLPKFEKKLAQYLRKDGRTPDPRRTGGALSH